MKRRSDSLWRLNYLFEERVVLFPEIRNVTWAAFYFKLEFTTPLKCSFIPLIILSNRLILYLL